MSELPIPDFYDPANASRIGFSPDQEALYRRAGEWRKRHGIEASSRDPGRVHLLLIDVQKDFCFPEGALYVGGRSGTGAMDDSDQIARFIYRNLGRVTEITCTLDTHFPHQIFFPSFWRDAEGNPLEAHREITAQEVRSGQVRPNPDVAPWLGEGEAGWLSRQVESYCHELEAAGKYRLYLWPPHCLLGSDGHALAGVVHEARMFHAYVRGARARMEIKGGNPLTEHYSVFAPEVLQRYDGTPLAQRNDRLVDTLLEADALIVGGQAASHCVRSSLQDLLREIRRRDPSLAGKVYVLEDCMSSVTVPDPERDGDFLFDFTSQAQDTLERLSEAGMHVVSSTAPMSDWLRTKG